MIYRMETTAKVINQTPPFSDFASFYDQFMHRYVDYPAWVKYIEKIFKIFKVRPKKILDLACGTGIPTILFAQRGYSMIGIDRSLAMLEKLREKSQNHNYNITTELADMREFSIPDKVDAVICLYDSINYLLTGEDLKRCFQCVKNVLDQNGLFVFDMNTIYGLTAFWDKRETVREVGNIRSIWRNTSDEKSNISTLRLTCYVKDENRYFEEIHQERGYELAYVQELLNSCDFSDVRFYQHRTFSPPNEVTIRVMVVARRLKSLNR
ncbi:MAG: class I SAM-dependent methyltransferase [candidate division WOR-3 bacterium]|nr:class I SAM-dependent methyltransferase [candidate division WOR-3 bacterium]